ncbi:MAG: S8 family serine peptidase [Bacteriovoracaceae bacterium]
MDNQNIKKVFLMKVFSLVLVLILTGCSSITEGRFKRSMASVENAGQLIDIKETKRRIVVLKNGVTESSRNIQREFARKFKGTRGHIYRKAIKGFAISLPENALSVIKKDKRVRYIINDKPIKAYSQTLPTGIQRINAHKNSLAAIGNDGGNVDVDVAVIDSGVDLDHPDLNIFRSVNFAKGKSANDGNGHGTHVAGTIGAIDDNNGVVGVAPGARIWGVRVLDNKGSGWTSDIIKGIDYVTQNASQIEVANMSLGGSGSDDGNCGLTNNDPMHEAICNSVSAGVVYVVAAGNENDDSKNHTPAAYDEVITVSALNDIDGLPGGQGGSNDRGDDDTLASFSNYGEDVDIAAPGVDIYSTYKGGVYSTMDGTSMAAPHVAGAAALYIAKNGKPLDGNDVLNVKNALISMGYQQSGPNGFFGDKDSFAEPLLNAEAIDPMGPPEPSVILGLSSNKSSYNTTQGDSVAVITAMPRDESLNPISGLDSSAFSSQLDSNSTNLLFTEDSTSGTYKANLDITGLSDGDHSLSVSVTDSRSLLGSNSLSFNKTSTAISIMHVESVSYALSGGRGGDKNLLVSIEVMDQSSTPVVGATVSIDLYRAGSFIGSGSGQTESNGVITFQLRNASAGCYNTTVTGVTHPDYEYDSSKNNPDPGFCK